MCVCVCLGQEKNSHHMMKVTCFEDEVLICLLQSLHKKITITTATTTIIILMIIMIITKRRQRKQLWIWLLLELAMYSRKELESMKSNKTWQERLKGNHPIPFS